MSFLVSQTDAYLLAALHTIIYVGVLYVVPTARPSSTLSKDHPTVIKSRFCAVAAACLLSLYISTLYTNDIVTFLKLWPINFTGVARGLYPTLVLFSGPLFEWLWADQGWRTFITNGIAEMRTWIGWRNYFIGPLTEELVFRGCVVPLFVLSKVPEYKIIFLTPLFFGVAHVHHFYQFYLVNPDLWKIGLLQSLFQFCYTTIFGWYAVFLFLHVQTLWALFIVHTFCNIMGLPRLWGSVTGRPINTFVYYIILFSGLAGFIRTMVGMF